MIKPRIVVTGATRKTGSIVVTDLLKADYPVRATVRPRRWPECAAKGRSPEDFEMIARRYAAQPRNKQTLGNWLREFARFMIAPLSPGFNLDRYDRELRRPFRSHPSPSSRPSARSGGANTVSLTCQLCSVSSQEPTSATSRPQPLESQ